VWISAVLSVLACWICAFFVAALPGNRLDRLTRHQAATRAAGSAAVSMLWTTNKRGVLAIGQPDIVAHNGSGEGVFQPPGDAATVAAQKQKEMKPYGRANIQI
jgi:hypothetical protein